MTTKVRSAAGKDASPARPFRVRGRFDIMFVFDGGGSLRVTSDPKRSLSAAKVVQDLREWADKIDSALRNTP